MKQLTTYINEKANFIVKKHVNNSIKELSFDDFKNIVENSKYILYVANLGPLDNGNKMEAYIIKHGDKTIAAEFGQPTYLKNPPQTVNCQGDNPTEEGKKVINYFKSVVDIPCKSKNINIVFDTVEHIFKAFDILNPLIYDIIK